jgi:hypothetical protein
MISEEALVDVLKHDLSRFLPIRIILRPDDKHIYKGVCEDSFSMSTSENYVRIWWSGRAYSLLGEHNINGIDDAAHNAKDGDLIYDPFSEDCPVEIGWKRWMSSTSKYTKRNAPFRVKEIK